MVRTLTAPHTTGQAVCLKPLPFWASLLLFAIPAMVFRLFVYNGIAALVGSGVRWFEAFIIGYGIPLAIMLTGSLIAYRIEGNPLDWGSFASRFRLQRMGGRDWAVTGLGYIIGFFGSGALLFTTQLIATIPLFAPPAALPPVVNPLTPLNIAPTHFMDVPLAGNWWVIALYLGLLFFNIVGEEFWWRGYILPRQELQHGRWTWVLHGLMWTLFHVPIYPWSILSLLPTCLSLAYVAQRTRNTWPGIITHFLTNGLAMLPLVLGVLGIKLG